MYLLVTIIHDNKFVNRPPCDMYLAFHIHVASKGPFFVDVNQHYITISLFATPPLGQLLSTSQLLPDFGATPSCLLSIKNGEGEGGREGGGGVEG